MKLTDSRKVGIATADLLTHEEQVRWKLVRENGSIRRGRTPGTTRSGHGILRKAIFCLNDGGITGLHFALRRETAQAKKDCLSGHAMRQLVVVHHQAPGFERVLRYGRRHTVLARGSHKGEGPDVRPSSPSYTKPLDQGVQLVNLS